MPLDFSNLGFGSGRANPGDPGQQMQWAAGKAGDAGDAARGRFGELTDWDSDYNQGLLDFYMKYAKSISPSQDTLFALNRGVGGLSGGSSATMALEQSEASQLKATDAANQAFKGHVLQNEGIAQGYLGLEAGTQANLAGAWGDRWKTQKGFDMQQSQWGMEFLNSIIGIAGAKWIPGL